MSSTSCQVCSGGLEPSQYGGYLHANDADDADGHTPVLAP